MVEHISRLTCRSTMMTAPRIMQATMIPLAPKRLQPRAATKCRANQVFVLIWWPLQHLKLLFIVETIRINNCSPSRYMLRTFVQLGHVFIPISRLRQSHPQKQILLETFSPDFQNYHQVYFTTIFHAYFCCHLVQNNGIGQLRASSCPDHKSSYGVFCESLHHLKQLLTPIGMPYEQTKRGIIVVVSFTITAEVSKRICPVYDQLKD